ncbi:MAG: ATPase, partial [Verrucomicrobia bacterium]|nr:ATPase [Verrucomicrobiota bacterium]
QHAHASEVEFRLTAGEESIEVVIADNGCGYDLDAGTAGGHGLRNLSNRLENIGGRCRMESRPGFGTTVWIDLPLPVLKERKRG